MVFIKASLGQELRKFSFDKEGSIDSLKASIQGLFPALSEVDPQYLVLYYRDSDGDLITVSSNQELHTALTGLGDTDTLKVSVRVACPPPKEKQEEEEEEEEMEGGDLFGDLFHSMHSLFDHPFHHGSGFHHHSPYHGPYHGFEIGPSWFGRQHALRLHEEKIRQQRLYEEKMRQARLEQMKAMREKAQKEQADLKKKITEERRKSTDLQRKEGYPPFVPQFPPGWEVSTFGSWDPVVKDGLTSTQKTWGPYGYVAYFNPQEKKEEETPAAPTEGGEEEKTPAASTEGGEKTEEGMEATS